MNPFSSSFTFKCKFSFSLKNRKGLFWGVITQKMALLFHSCRKGVNKGGYLGAMVLNKVPGWFLIEFQEMNLTLS